MSSNKAPANSQKTPTPTTNSTNSNNQNTPQQQRPMWSKIATPFPRRSPAPSSTPKAKPGTLTGSVRPFRPGQATPSSTASPSNIAHPVSIPQQQAANSPLAQVTDTFKTSMRISPLPQSTESGNEQIPGSNTSEEHAAGKVKPTQVGKTDQNISSNQERNKKQDDGGDSDEEQLKRPAFFDQKYATTTALGVGGQRVDILVNRFRIPYDATLKSLFVYKIHLPQYNGRTVKNSNVKKIMIGQILSEQQPWTANANDDKIFTDWDCLMVTKEPLEQLSPGGVRTTADGAILTDFHFRNQSSPASAPAQPLQAQIKLLTTLDLQEFKDYLNGKKPADFDFSQYVRAFNIMVRHFAAQDPDIFRAGRNRFFSAAPEYGLPSHIVARNGFFNSVRPSNQGYQLHVNTTTAAFYPDDRLVTFLKNRFGSEFNEQSSELTPQVKNTIRNLQVRYMYMPSDASAATTRSRPITDPVARGCRLKRINGFGQSAREQKFEIDKKVFTVQNHFNDNILLPQHKLKLPELPVVNTGAANEPGKEVYVPMELLWIEPGQALRTTVPSDDMNQMAQVSRRRPKHNVQQIEGPGLRLLQALTLNRKNILPFESKLMQISGRVLSVPNLQYRQMTRDRDRDKMAQGKWNLQGKKFQAGGHLGNLLIIQVGLKEPITRPSAGLLIESLEQYGIKVSGEKSLQRPPSATVANLNMAFDRMGASAGKIVLVILPKFSIDDYALIKHWGDCIKGVNTICLTHEKCDFTRDDGGLRANLALKFNAKLNGQNHTLTNDAYNILHGGPGNALTMVVGADVTHPGPSSVPYCPSIAAVVASTNRECVRFPGSMRLQRGKTEQILELMAMMVERLRIFHQTNKALPAKILYYRDGVGENQYAMVKNHELNDIKAACSSIAQQLRIPNYDPPITVVVCTKRHMTRFYPSENTPGGVLDRQGHNFNPGLVVDDKSIRLPNLFDFWLQAQKPLQGTGRPCHYFVLDNGIGFTPTQIQQVTFNLSWVYATSLTPISVTAPAYYADKLCERGRCYIRQLLVSKHPQRPAKMNDLSNILPNDYDWKHATDEQIRDDVARTLTHGNYDVWRHPENPNPCHDAIKDTMFYI